MRKGNEPIKIVYPAASSNSNVSETPATIHSNNQLQHLNATMNNQTSTTNRVAFTNQSLPNGTISITTQPTQLGHHSIMHPASSASVIPTSTTIKTISTSGAGQNQNHPHSMGGSTQTLVIKNQTVSLPAGLVSSAPGGLVTMTKAINQGNQASIVSNMLPAGVVMGVRANTPNTNPQKSVNSNPLPRVVIGNTHMVGARPNNPAITLSTIQQSGPALIVKTENGYQLLRVSPATPTNQPTTNIGQQMSTSTGNQTIRLQTVPASMSVSAPSNIVVNSAGTSNSNQILANQVNSTASHHQPTVAPVVPVTSVLQTQQFNQPASHQTQHQQQPQTQAQSSQSSQIQLHQPISSQQVQQQPQPQLLHQQSSHQQPHVQTSNQSQTLQVQQTQQNALAAGSGINQQINTSSVQQKSLQGNTKEKCRKFLANLIELSTREPKPVERSVRTLIQELIDSIVEPEDFCDRLERLLNASPQPCLIGFLKKSLPLLRQSLFTRELVIDGIKPPPQHVVSITSGSALQQQFPRIQAQIRPIGQATTIGQTQVRMVTQTAPRPIGQTTITKQTISSGVKIQSPLSTPLSGPRLNNTQIRSIGAIEAHAVQQPPALQPVNRNQVFQAPQNIVTVKGSQSGIRVPGNVQIRPATSVRAKTSTNTSTTMGLNQITMPQVKVGQTQIKQLTPIQNNNSSICSTIPAPPASLPVVSAPILVSPAPVSFPSAATTPSVNNTNSSTVLNTTTAITTSITTPTSTPKIITVKAQNSSQVIARTTSKKKQLLEEKSVSATSFFQQPSMSTASSMYGDDDINDVAAMGGVNLAEESQKILGSTENIGTQIRSCKDEVFLHLPALQSKIKNLVTEKGLEDPSQEVSVLISHACQERLKNIVEKLAVIAEHRIDILKIDSRYEVTKDIRGQIKFLEELDKAEQKRHEEQEREMLFRAAKSRSKIEDPEQAKLKAKAKEMQRAEMEEIRHQESNKTALQAIGPPRKKTKFDGDVASSGSQSTSYGAGASGISSAVFRPRIKRVNLRDMLFFMEQERETCRSLTLYKSYLK
ncbi:transcription initiation factor TFIID subunit 4 isoform X2 [Condylostylus longicornis]|uniref:transcription initiation factor TFIID subunit 4 isoform X2 n=1 Tax=Condylostylus longicornis TaxID=2530218 RepID=UPI00244D9DE0|nr:transcription initiation factor TFIID subunit 4 isoform X2 [Condylostylus longicornis]